MHNGPTVIDDDNPQPGRAESPRSKRRTEGGAQVQNKPEKIHRPARFVATREDVTNLDVIEPGTTHPCRSEDCVDPTCPYKNAPADSCGQLLRFGYCKFAFAHAENTSRPTCRHTQHVVRAINGTYYQVPHPELPMKSTNLTKAAIKERQTKERREKAQRFSNAEAAAVGRTITQGCSQQAQEMQERTRAAKRDREAQAEAPTLDDLHKLGTTFLMGQGLSRQTRKK